MSSRVIACDTSTADAGCNRLLAVLGNLPKTQLLLSAQGCRTGILKCRPKPLSDLICMHRDLEPIQGADAILEVLHDAYKVIMSCMCMPTVVHIHSDSAVLHHYGPIHYSVHMICVL